jgi:hypothetical protein
MTRICADEGPCPCIHHLSDDGVLFCLTVLIHSHCFLVVNFWHAWSARLSTAVSQVVVLSKRSKSHDAPVLFAFKKSCNDAIMDESIIVAMPFSSYDDRIDDNLVAASLRTRLSKVFISAAISLPFTL